MAAPSATGRRSGAALFAGYAFPPNELGYCGPDGSSVLLEGGATGDLDTEVARRARLFDGAWPYLELIAAATGIADPLDPRVVRAYWLGGDLLDHVDGEVFEALVRDRFGAQPGVTERLDHGRVGGRIMDAGVIGAGVIGAGPHHGFHVLVVYPWIGLLDRGPGVALSVLDSCRVRWGLVESVDGDRVSVRTPALQLAGGELVLGGEQALTARWAAAGHAFVSSPEPGEWVALHWDWVCDRLSDDAVVELRGRTDRQLAAANAWLASRHPG